MQLPDGMTMASTSAATNARREAVGHRTGGFVLAGVPRRLAAAGGGVEQHDVMALLLEQRSGRNGDVRSGRRNEARREEADLHRCAVLA